MCGELLYIFANKLATRRTTVRDSSSFKEVSKLRKLRNTICQGATSKEFSNSRTEKRVVEPMVPWEIRNQVKAKGSERFLLVIDVDRFTRKKLNRDQVGFNEWISGSNRVIRKSISQAFLNE